MTKFLLDSGNNATSDYEIYREFCNSFRGSSSLVVNPKPGFSERFLVEEAYIEGVQYNPSFNYAETQPSSHELLFQLRENLDTGSNFTHGLLHNHIVDLTDYNDIMQNHSPAAIDQYSRNKFGEVSVELLEDAKKIINYEMLNPSKSQDPAVLDALMVKEILELVLLEFFPEYWRVEILTSMHARLSISPSRTTVNLRSNLLISEKELLRLVAHELGVHSLRVENGFNQKSPLWAIGMGPDHLKSEEGLAVWVENKLGLLDHNTKLKYALRVYALSLAPKLSFAEVYALLREFTTAEESYDISNRVKRGFQDTAMLGAYYKDKVYLEGFRLISNYLTLKPEMINILLAGKFSVSQLDLPEFPLGEIIPYGYGMEGITNMVDFAAHLITQYTLVES
jgi:hypothetical protein